MKVLVTGAEGQLGRSLVRLLASDWQVLAVNRRELDIVDAGAVRAQVAAMRPAAIVNCAAYNEVDRAEDEPATAFAVNAFGVRSLARAAADVGALFVHYSTDFVFDGESESPYLESDPPRPLSVYGHSKLLGERYAGDAVRYYVLRLASLFGGGLHPDSRRRGSTLDRIADAMMAGRDVKGFVDRIASPSYVEDVAQATSRLLSVGAPEGIYHCVNSGMASWYDMSLEAARLLGSTAGVVPIRMRDVTARPRFCALSNDRLAAAGIAMPTWQDALARYLRERAAQRSSVCLGV
jgi:dTDP-4-dehydrorhamnose reductase